MAGRGREAASHAAQQEFVGEAEDLLEQLRAGLADLRDGLAAQSLRPEVLNALFRAAHSLKSLAGLFEVEPIRELAHQLEDALDALRMGRVADAAAAGERVAEAVAIFAELLPRLGDAAAIAELEAPTRELCARIAALRETQGAGPDLVDALGLDAVLRRALTEYEEHRLRESLAGGRCVALLEAVFDLISFERGLGSLSQALQARGELLSTLPSPGETPASQIRFSLLVASDADEASLREIARAAGASLRVLRARAAPPPAPASAELARASARSGAHDGGAPQLPASLRSVSETVRVDFRKLDALMNLVAELASESKALAGLAGRIAALPGGAQPAAALAALDRALERRLRALQAAVLEVRLVPLHQIFEKIARAARGLERGLGKRLRLELEGGDTELDKRIVEELVDPLLQLVRNALDHALEPPAQRVAAGKDPIGTIRIAAMPQGSHVVVEVEDDGAGIDGERLRQRAVERGLIAADAPLSPRERLELAFLPGLSTREAVTETSGRGVGMDVVRANLAALGGRVELHSTPGQGTRVSLTLPITLAILPSLIVQTAGQRFALPVGAVHETLALGPDAIQRSCGRELMNLRGDPLPLRRLCDALGLPRSARGDGYAVVIGSSELRMGLLVDALDGQQDTVIKPIQGARGDLRGIAGATELGDPEPVLVLDVAALLEDAALPGARP